MSSIPHWFGAAALGVVVLVIAVCAGLWSTLGASNISPAGWIAMILGVIATLGLGMGLMALVFISNRRGYDELDGRPR